MPLAEKVLKEHKIKQIKLKEKVKNTNTYFTKVKQFFIRKVI